jgi:hypothetical protein
MMLAEVPVLVNMSPDFNVGDFTPYTASGFTCITPNQFYQWMVATAARMLLQGVHVDHGMVAAYLHGFSIVAPRCPSVHIMMSCSSCSADVET